jgi:replication initiation protein RepC
MLALKKAGLQRVSRNPKETFMLESPLPLPSKRPPGRPTGARRIDLTMRVQLDRADSFAGAPRGSAKPLRYLSAFREAEPYLGLPVHAFKLISWLVEWTQPQDWEEGSRPIAWPSARLQEEFLGLKETQVKHLNRALFEAGIFVIRDNEQGKRYGRRDDKGRIIEAYGFDLSLLALRCEEFIKIAAEARVERERMRKLRRRSTRARRAITQAGEELAAQDVVPPEWTVFAREVAELAAGIRRAHRSDELGAAVEALERRQQEAEAWLRQHIKPVETDAEGSENRPHQYTTTTLTPNPMDTVAASEGSSRGAARPSDPSPTLTAAEKLFPERMGMRSEQLVELAPRLEQYLARGKPLGWREIVDAAEWLGGELGVSRTLWAQACRVMGRDNAAVAVALVSTRPPEHFTSSPAGYFAGMLRKFEKGELNLDRTLWKLRDQKWGQAGRRRAAAAV